MFSTVSNYTASALKSSSHSTHAFKTGDGAHWHEVHRNPRKTLGKLCFPERVMEIL